MIVNSFNYYFLFKFIVVGDTGNIISDIKYRCRKKLSSFIICRKSYQIKSWYYNRSRIWS